MIFNEYKSFETLQLISLMSLESIISVVGKSIMKIIKIVVAVDLEAAKEFGVKCLYAPVANSTSVSETALLHMLYLSFNVDRLQKMLKVDFYDAKLNTHMTTLDGKTVGIIGCGNIGSRVAKNV